jgi:hypothetical protein
VRVTKITHLTPQCPGIGGALGLLVTGSFRAAMMGGEAFILLKAGQTGPESAKQAEIRLASLPTILHNRPSPGETPRKRRKAHLEAAVSAGYA